MVRGGSGEVGRGQLAARPASQVGDVDSILRTVGRNESKKGSNGGFFFIDLYKGSFWMLCGE